MIHQFNSDIWQEKFGAMIPINASQRLFLFAEKTIKVWVDCGFSETNF